MTNFKNVSTTIANDDERPLLTFEEVSSSVMANPKMRAAVIEQRAVLATSRLIRETREEAGLSQSELALRLGVTQARVSSLESGCGKKGPSIGLLARIAEACGGSLALNLSTPAEAPR